MQTKVEMIAKEYFIAEDGRKFDKEKDCIKHDAELKIKKLEEEKEYGICLNLLETGEFIQDFLNNILLSYFHLYNDICTYGRYYVITIDDEKAKQWAEAICEYNSGMIVDHGFEIGNKYIIYVKLTATKMFGEEGYVYVTKYDDLINYYEGIVERIKSIF